MPQARLELPKFTNGEFESRLARTQALMRDHALDAILITSPPNFRYYSGFDSQFWESPTRPWFLVLPADGRCIAVVPEIGAPLLGGSWIEEVRSWPAPRPTDDGISLLADTLNELPRKHGRLGLEMGRESVVRMPLADLFAVRDRLKGLEFADGSPCIWSTRKIKSRLEIERIRATCGIVCDAFDNLPSQLCAGQTEAEIARSLTIDILKRGADTVPFLAASSGPGGYAQIISRPSARVLGRGDILIIDVGATVDGYFCDFDRNFGFGNLSVDALAAQDMVWRATEAGIAAAVPGATAADLCSAMNSVLEESGAVRNNVGRLGHGLGLQLTEPPSNMPSDDTRLEPGMVMTIEPGIEYAPGKMIVHEENIVITESSPELLTRRAPRAMPVV